MASPYLKDFDTTLNQILVDYSNLDSAPDISAGSMPFINGSVLASGIWGLGIYQDWIHKMHFPDTADTENLNRHGTIYDIARIAEEEDADYLNRILSFLRQAPAGGNALDFENWALDQDNSYYETYYNAYATVVNVADGLGTVGVYTIPNDESVIDLGGSPDIEEELRQATETYIISMRPLGMLSVAVVSSKPATENVTIEVTPPVGGAIDTAGIQTAIENYMATLKPGQSLFASILSYYAKLYGAYSAEVTTPATEETTADNDEHIRKGTVTITEV